MNTSQDINCPHEAWRDEIEDVRDALIDAKLIPKPEIEATSIEPEVPA